MSDTPRRASSAAFSFLLLVATTMVFAPVFRAGNRPLPLLVLELLALTIFLLFVTHRESPWAALGRAERWAISLVVAIPLISLLPVPTDLWGTLPGRGVYTEALALFGGAEGIRALSVIGHTSQASALALLPPLAVFFATVACGDRERLRLVYVLLGVATLEALLGLVQYGSQDPLFYLGMEPTGSAQGSYANRNHFAGLFEMAFPLAAALFAASFGTTGKGARRYHGRGLRAAFATFGEARIKGYLLFLGLLALFGVAIVFSRSRTGIALLILGLIACTLAFAPRLGGRSTLRSVGGVMVLLFGTALSIGLVPVLQRFGTDEALGDGRWSIFAGTLQGIGTFFPLGSGVGTYPDVFRRFHPADLGLFINHAHNDYLEWLFEGGVLAALTILFLLALYLRRCLHVVRETTWPRQRFLRIGAAIGIFLIVLHGFVEYNLRIPANAIFFAFLMGLFYAPVAGAAENNAAARRRSTEDREAAPRPPTVIAPVPPAPEAPQPDAPNPFAR